MRRPQVQLALAIVLVWAASRTAAAADAMTPLDVLLSAPAAGTAGQAVVGAMSDLANAVLGDIADLAAPFGAWPKLGAVQGTLRALILDVITVAAGRAARGPPHWTRWPGSRPPRKSPRPGPPTSGLSTCAPPARKSMVEAEVERRRAFQGTLADLKGALAGGPLELVDAIGAAFGSLDLPGVFTSGNLSRLIDSALGLIGTTLADSQ